MSKISEIYEVSSNAIEELFKDTEKLTEELSLCLYIDELIKKLSKTLYKHYGDNK